MKRSLFAFVSAVLFILFLGVGTVHALMVDLTIPKDSPPFPEMTYATVSGQVDAVDQTLYHFRIDLAPDLDVTLNGTKGFGMDKFLFNSSLNITDDMFINFDPSTWKISYNKNAAGFGTFDVRLMGTNDVADHLYFDIDYTSPVTDDDFFLLSEGNAGNGNGHFAAHIRGFCYNGSKSLWVRDDTTVVPEPGSLFLLGSGILGLFAVGKKRR